MLARDSASKVPVNEGVRGEGAVPLASPPAPEVAGAPEAVPAAPPDALSCGAIEGAFTAADGTAVVVVVVADDGVGGVAY